MYKFSKTKDNDSLDRELNVFSLVNSTVNNSIMVQPKKFMTTEIWDRKPASKSYKSTPIPLNLLNSNNPNENLPKINQKILKKK